MDKGSIQYPKPNMNVFQPNPFPDRSDHSSRFGRSPPVKSNDNNDRKNKKVFTRDKHLRRNDKNLIKHLKFLQSQNRMARQIGYNQIRLFSNASDKRPSAWFECSVCKYCCDTPSVVKTHMNDERHVGKLKELMMKTTAFDIPKLPLPAERQLTNMLEEWAADSIYCRNLKERLQIRNVLNVVLETNNMLDYNIELYGSSLHGFGMKEADLNLLLNCAKEDASSVFDVIIKGLEEDGGFSDIEKVRTGSGKTTKLKFVHRLSELQCEISPSTIATGQLSKLIAKYADVDPRARKLIAAFRRWGSIVSIDKSAEGTFPGFTLYMMAIYYLQNCKSPVLPVFPLELSDLIGDGSDNDMLVSQYVEYCLQEAAAGPSDPTKFVTENEDSLATLFIGALKFFAYELGDRVVTISLREPMSRKEQGWYGIAVLDPLAPKRNLTKGVNNSKSQYYIEHCFKTSLHYMAIPQTIKGPLFGGICPVPNFNVLEAEAQLRYNKIAKIELALMKEIVDVIINTDRVLFTGPSLHQLNDEQRNNIMEETNRKLRDINISYGSVEVTSKDVITINLGVAASVTVDFNEDQVGIYREMLVDKDSADKLFSRLQYGSVMYQLNATTLKNDEPVPLICKRCLKEGHLNTHCPYDKLDEVRPMRQLSESSMKRIETLIFFIYEKYRPEPHELNRKRDIVQAIENFLRKDCKLDLFLKLFGSSINGFGFKNSDLDICVMFTDPRIEKEKLDQGLLIESLHNYLKNYDELKELHPIPTARVPILKFVHSRTNLEGDMSFYNELAGENSDLLRCYANIDFRVIVLVYLWKLFAQRCLIAEAAKGSIPTYGHVLMVIYYLQHCDPPVLPVLQELCPELVRTRTVEGKQIRYFSDIENLKHVWDGFQKNTSGLAPLWLGMIDFYSRRFNFEQNVISVRCSRVITKEEKQWPTKNISIEDPFDINHNLGSNLSHSMNIYIQNQIIAAREIFAAECSSIPLEFLEEAYFGLFSTEKFPASDRACRICKNIGHLAKDCPRAKRNKNKVEPKDKFVKKVHFDVKTAAKKLKNVQPVDSSTRENVKSTDRITVLPSITETRRDQNKQPSRSSRSEPVQRKQNEKWKAQKSFELAPARFVAPSNSSSRFCPPRFQSSAQQIPPFNFSGFGNNVDYRLPVLEQSNHVNQNGNAAMLRGAPLVQYRNYTPNNYQSRHAFPVPGPSPNPQSLGQRFNQPRVNGLASDNHMSRFPAGTMGRPS